MSFESSVHAKAIELTRLNVEITTAAGSGHPTSGASLAHITTILLYSHMRHDPAHPGHPGADRLVLSEGHAVPILYAAAADLGIMAQYGDQFRPTTREDVLQLRAIDSPIDGHPQPRRRLPLLRCGHRLARPGPFRGSGHRRSGPARRPRQARLLRHRRWRIPRRSDLGSRRTHRRSQACSGLPHLQLQQVRPVGCGQSPYSRPR
jgi:hypothetical protein